MKFKTLMLCALVLCTLSNIGCGSDSADCTVQAWNSEISAAVNAYNAAIQTFINDQSQSNCNRVIDAANDYLDAVENFDGCDVIPQADYNAAIQQAREALDQTIC